jgi:hypothetical protein
MPDGFGVSGMEFQAASAPGACDVALSVLFAGLGFVPYRLLA